MLAYNFIKDMITRAFLHNYVFIISGYNNDTQTDYTAELAEEIIDRFSRFGVVVFPALGFWEGVKENSLVVVLRDVSSKQTYPIGFLNTAVRNLAAEFNQYAVLAVYNGEFHNLVNREKSDEKDSILGDSFSENITGAIGYTKVLLTRNYQTLDNPVELFSFTITNRAAEKIAA